ncbi:DNA alkylation repair protein [Succinivibrio sp.]|uniref:DNA alkylation repair protein n=1 Tax=Succinivibrio sp. TaxID=2053619 RepID=UPI003866FA77
MSTSTAICTKEIEKILCVQKDEKYREFTSKICKDDIILGVKVPTVRKTALSLLKHNYDLISLINQLDENSYFETRYCLAVAISKADLSFEDTIELIRKFFKLLNSWTIVDGFCTLLKPFIKKNKNKFFEFIKPLFDNANPPFVRRFAIVCANNCYCSFEYMNYLFSVFDKADDSHYYVHMAIAWCIATMYCTDKDSTIEYLKKDKLSLKTHNKAIAKIIESRIPSADEKRFIRTLKK